ncbi:HAMP domain-containing sensor histidine kinase [Desulfitobacterium sp.]|uniref:sensor histidine kinase n=1 Tax=Desulfitobacterium sp. TaxID=49981 RepID=UPI002CD1F1CD|nr:HAMP domain-containing sensor histidine kinase [Desulfitobacterium sp.]HVJ48509.1 HAMP domain-containing sensor histidine kinase [Desulfitobacterium sp.]
MDLKRRLIVTNATTVIIPLIVTVVFAMAFLFISNNLSNHDLSLENYQKQSKVKLELLNIEQSILRQTPEAIESPEFQKNIQDRLSTINGDVIILKDEQVLFTSHNISKIDIAKSLDAGNSKWGNSTVKIGNVPYSVQAVKLSLAGRSTGTVLMLAPVDLASASDMTHFLIFVAIIFILFFVLTNVLVSYQFAHRILSPLNHLKKAATEISGGNLDFPIVEEGDQELQELCRDLELMRLKLKDSIHTQLKFEENRKMLISSISHDLKTPVTSIKGYVEGIMDGVANTPEKQERYLKTIYTKAQLVDEMIEDLLLYAKLDLNQLPFDFERTDISEYLYEFVRENEPECTKNGIQLTLQKELSQPYTIQLDRARFRRVLMNILDNSRKYMTKEDREQAGLIQISLRETPSSVILELRDNGIGIPEKDLSHIFDRFYRSDTSRGEIKGSGLGLAIAKQIVEGHNGRIWALSHAQEGTSILISLSK